MMSCRRPGLSPHFEAFDARALADRRARPARVGAEARRIASCGAPLGDVDIAIVDPETGSRRAPGDIGEIWVSDPAVALGYWRRPDSTRETFQARIADDGAGPYLRTGDLGFLHGGELYVSGRIKDLIIVAGANHYPQDIEWTVEQAHPAVRPGHVAAASFFAGGEERLLVAPEIERGAIGSAEEAEALIAAIRRAVTEGHEVAVDAVIALRRGSLQKTASGKIQRHTCARLADEPSEDVVVLWRTGMTKPQLLGLGEPVSEE